MKKHYTGLAVLLFLAIALTMGSVSAEAQQSANKKSIPPMIGIAASGLGSNGHAMAVAYAPHLQEYFGVPVRVMPSWSAAPGLLRIKDRRAHFNGGGISQSMALDTIFAKDYFADADWGPQEVGIIWNNTASPYGIVVRGDSDIKKMSDLKGKTAAIYITSPAWTIGLKGCLAFGGLTIDDIKTVEVGGYSQCARAVADGRADFTYNCPQSPVSFEIAEGPHGTRYIPMALDDKEGWDRFGKIRSDCLGAACKAGPKSSLGVPMVCSPFVLWTYKWLDDDLVYEIAKFFAENLDKYKGSHPYLYEMSLEETVKFKDRLAVVPFLPGTVKYLKERGLWSEDDEKWNNEGWKTEKKLRELWDQAVEEAHKKKIKVDYKNKKWVELWNKYRSSVPSMRPRAAYSY